MNVDRHCSDELCPRAPGLGSTMPPMVAHHAGVNGETPDLFAKMMAKKWRYGYRIPARGDCGETSTRLSTFTRVVQIYAFAVLFSVRHVTL
jgi:hypothetical protein